MPNSARNYDPDRTYPERDKLNPFSDRKEELSSYYERYHNMINKSDKGARPDSARTNYLLAV